MGCLKLNIENPTLLKVLNGGKSSNSKTRERSYWYGFQGQEKDDEIKGEGNSLSYTFRMHDPRIGRFFAIDPLTGKYPQWSPYQFSGNQVIATVELEGLEPQQDLNTADVNQKYQGTNKQSGSDNTVYNWSIKQTLAFYDEAGQPVYNKQWEIGTEYRGPNKNEAAFIEDNVYTQTNYTKESTTLLSSEQQKLEKNIAGNYTLTRMDVGKDGFQAGVYTRTIDGVTFTVIAFAGTNNTIDWLTNAKQGAGLKDSQYDYAVNLAYAFNGAKNLSFVGHSLGGGLASLAALVTDRYAITFNAAGLSDGTLSRYNVSNKGTKKIDAFIIRGEVLNYLLSYIDQGAIGNYHKLEPQLCPPTGGEEGSVMGWRVTLHGMDQVKKSLGIK